MIESRTQHAQPAEVNSEGDSSQGAESQLLQALLDSAGEGIWGVDLEGTCTFVNRSALSMLGYTAEELVGRNMHRMIHHHYPTGEFYPGEECIIYGVFRRNTAFQNQVDHLFRKDGSLFWTEMSAQPVVVHGVVQGAVVTFRDITQARLAEEALRRSEKLAAVGQLASSIAHEINNPLEAVTNLLYLVRHSESPAEIAAYAAQAEIELARVSEITMQTLRFHKQQTLPALADARAMVEAVLRLHHSRMSARRVQLCTRLDAVPQVSLLEGEIRQVVNNLVRNAYEAMPEGGRLLVRLRAVRAGAAGSGQDRPGIRITIADTGTGFLPGMRAHLFEPFHTSKEITGTGLGLWISKGIVDKHNGRLAMRSQAGRGTVFTLWLPLEPQAPDAQYPAETASR